MLKLPEYFARFVRHNWPQKPNRWGDVTDELIQAAASGTGNRYSCETASNLIASREAGKQPEECGYYGN